MDSNPGMDENELTHNVLKLVKVREKPGMHAVVARHLHDMGRKGAARQVLGVEKDSVGKVTAMCGMGMFKAAAQAAADDGDVDLIAFVLHEFERSFDGGRNRSAFYMGLAEFPRSMRGMVKVMAGEGERKEVKAMLVKAGDVVEAGNTVLKEYLEERAMGGEPEKKLEECKKIFALKPGTGWKERCEEEVSEEGTQTTEGGWDRSPPY